MCIFLKGVALRLLVYPQFMCVMISCLCMNAYRNAYFLGKQVEMGVIRCGCKYFCL